MAAARRDVGQRSPGRDAHEAPLRIQLVEKRDEVVLVGAAPVVEHQRALGLAGRLADEVNQAQAAACLGLTTGVSTRSISSR